MQLQSVREPLPTRCAHTSWQTEGRQGQPVSLTPRTQNCRLKGIRLYYTQKAKLDAQLIPRLRAGKAMLHEQRNPQHPKTLCSLLQESSGCQEARPSSAFSSSHQKPDSVRAAPVCFQNKLCFPGRLSRWRARGALPRGAACRGSAQCVRLAGASTTPTKLLYAYRVQVDLPLFSTQDDLFMHVIIKATLE